ncbi:MAG: addiction module protein [Holophagales bacterium]|nr:addiction module protein [Holophagales bacterium]
MNEAIPAATWVAAALKLPAETWELLFELLLQDLPAENDPEIEAAWLAEVERRMRETDPSRLIPADEVFARVRATLRRPPPPQPPVEVDALVLPVRDVIDACQALPADERLRLAGSYLRRERASGTSQHPKVWLEDSARWLAAARAARRAGV